MNKMEFFKVLEEGLIDFPSKELQEILYDYKEHFANAQVDGKTEEDIIEELGDPYTIVNQYRSGYITPLHQESSNNSKDEFEEDSETTQQSYNNYNNTKNSGSTANTILKICIVIGLFFLFFPVGFGGLTAIFGVCVSLLVVPFALSISGILMLFGKFGFTILGFGVPAFFADFPNSVIALITIGSIAATIFCLILLIYLFKFVIILIKKLINKLFGKEGR